MEPQTQTILKPTAPRQRHREVLSQALISKELANYLVLDHFPFGCLLDLQIDVLPKEGVQITKTLHEEPPPRCDLGDIDDDHGPR